MCIETTKKLLVDNLKPIKRLASPVVLTLRFSLVCFFYFVLYEVLTNEFSNSLTSDNSFFLISRSIIILSIFFLTALHCFKLSIPGVVNNYISDILISTLNCIWPLTVYFSTSPTFTTPTTSEPDYICSISIILLSILPTLILYTMITTAEIINKLRVLFFGTLSALTAGAFILEYVCPQTTKSHILVWHILPIFILGIVITVIFAFWKKELVVQR